MVNDGIEIRELGTISNNDACYIVISISIYILQSDERSQWSVQKQVKYTVNKKSPKNYFHKNIESLRTLRSKGLGQNNSLK